MSKELHLMKNKIILALIVYTAVVITDKSANSFLPQEIHDNKWLMLIIYLVPYGIAGFSVIKEAVEGLLKGRMLDESLLMTLATVGAFITGENPEACAVMLFYQVGEFFQEYAVDNSRNSIEALLEILPEYANIEQNGRIRTVPPSEIKIGDVIVIKPGERIPADGTIISGESELDTAAITGESMYRNVVTGDQAFSGCVNGSGVIRLKVDKEYKDSTVMKILEMVENAAERKSKRENFITVFTRYYTPIVVIGAIALAVLPSLVIGDPGKWMYRACVFLVISCPCALVISVPLAFFCGIGVSSRDGVLVKGANFLELMSKIDTIVSDKTGTLTVGEFRVNKIIPADGVSERDVLSAAEAAERMSNHPIAISIRRAFEEICIKNQNSEETCLNENDEIDEKNESITFRNSDMNADISNECDFDEIDKDIQAKNFPGRGSAAVWKGHRLLAGNSELMKENGVSFNKVDDPTSTVVYVAKDNIYLGAILASDAIKGEAVEAVKEMRDEGASKFVMLTGDRREVGQIVGQRIGADIVFSELLPGDKVARIEELIREEDAVNVDDKVEARNGVLDKEDGSKSVVVEQKNRKRKKYLAFIGDGINDAPSLSRADIGIAMGSMGSDAAIEAADIVIMDDDLKKIPKTMKTGRKTVTIASQNIVFAIVVKILILVLGALGIANMWAAVFSDVGVAIICVFNSMRMLRRTR